MLRSSPLSINDTQINLHPRSQQSQLWNTFPENLVKSHPPSYLLSPARLQTRLTKDAFSPQWENYNGCWGQESVFLPYCESCLGSGYCLFFLQLCLFHISCGPLWGQLFDQQLSSLRTVRMYFSHPVLFCPLIFIYSPLILLINWLLSYCCPNPCNSCSFVLSYPQPAATFNRNTISSWHSI